AFLKLYHNIAAPLLYLSPVSWLGIIRDKSSELIQIVTTSYAGAQIFGEIGEILIPYKFSGVTPAGILAASGS
ncbi:MAG TPA: hypothetical protein DIW17_18425, partial [Clostridiales bacterium]|nr:hypothetical protein [Clostridiales bacterium]